MPGTMGWEEMYGENNPTEPYTTPSRNDGCVRLHQMLAIPESESRSMPFDYIIPELEWPEFNSAVSGLEAEF